LRRNLTIVVAEPIHPDGIGILRKHGNVIQLPAGSTSRDLLAAAGEADAIVTRGFIRIPRENLEKAEKLKVIGVHGVGVDHIDVDYAEHRGIRIVRAAEAQVDAVAEFTIGLMLSLLRRIPAADAAVRSGEWDRKYGDLTGSDLAGKTVGIIGLGRIGSQVAKRLKAFGTRLLYYQRIRNPALEKQLGIKYASLSQLLEASDIITIHAVLTPETRHMISREQFRLMKTGVYIVNTARGAIIDEKALHDALVSGKVAGAALDVFESEPISSEHAFTRLGNVILAPHLASCTNETLRRLAVTVAEKVVKALSEQEETCENKRKKEKL
jgi:D-3-phosphoglycerate dehydrogenase